MAVPLTRRETNVSSAIVTIVELEGLSNYFKRWNRNGSPRATHVPGVMVTGSANSIDFRNIIFRIDLQT